MKASSNTNFHGASGTSITLLRTQQEKKEHNKKIKTQNAISKLLATYPSGNENILFRTLSTPLQKSMFLIT
jgi:hypothetical protein